VELFPVVVGYTIQIILTKGYVFPVESTRHPHGITLGPYL